MILNYKSAKNKLLAPDTDFNIDGCRQFFAKNGYAIEYAYCELLSDNIRKSKEIFNSVSDNDIRAHWASFMISLIEGDVRENPTYFELRNFLEIDINILISYYKGDYVEKIVRYADFLFTINPEVHKFIGRVLWNNNFEEQAMFFLSRAKSYFYQDPELHYLLAAVYNKKNDFDNTVKALNSCLDILPNYYPAVNLLQKIKTNTI